MNKTLNTILKTIEILKEADLLATANSMTYKLLFAIFPFLMFLLTLMGFFTIDYHYLTDNLYHIVPADVLDIVETFAMEVINVRRPRLLSISLAIALFSSTSGFSSLIYGLKKAYKIEETRGYIKILAASVSLTFLFVVAVILSTVGIILSGIIMDAVMAYFVLSQFLYVVLQGVSFAVSFCVMLVVVVLINRIALQGKVRVKEILPGAFFTVFIWALASLGFNVYISNFNNMATVYGSVAGVMIMLIWLNIICSVLLVGGAVNGALLDER